MQSGKFNYLLEKYKYEKTAAQTIYLHYFPKIVSYINYSFSNKVDGRDIAHQFFVWLFTYVPGEKILYPSSWVFNKTYFLSLDVLRENKNRALAEQHTTPPNIQQFPDSAFDILKCLNSDERQVIFLIYWQDYTLKEIAIKLNLKYAAVKYLHKKAKRKLKKDILKGEK